MELRDALSQISEIRHRLAETELFRGYRSLPCAFSGALAIAAAALQPAFVPDPVRDVFGYCSLWIGVALLSMAAVGLTMVLRDRLGGASQTREVTLLAVSQLLPSLVAGGLITWVIARQLPDSAALLPGLWQVLFSLGLFASCRLLPRAVFGIALFYLVSGIVMLSIARGEFALSPWAMGVPFSIGQFLSAGVLYWNLERNHEEV